MKSNIRAMLTRRSYFTDSTRPIIENAIQQFKQTNDAHLFETNEHKPFLLNTVLREKIFYSQLDQQQLSKLCIFCNEKIIQEGHVISSKYFTCLYNIRPVFPGHVLILPKYHISKIEDIRVDHAVDYLQFTQNIIRALKQVYNTDSINVIVQQGEYSGQSVQHLHTHFLPRVANDLPMIVQAVTTEKGEVVENQEQEWMDYFRQQEHTARLLTAEERQVEAEKIRKAYKEY